MLFRVDTLRKDKKSFQNSTCCKYSGHVLYHRQGGGASFVKSQVLDTCCHASPLALSPNHFKLPLQVVHLFRASRGHLWERRSVDVADYHHHHHHQHLQSRVIASCFANVEQSYPRSTQSLDQPLQRSPSPAAPCECPASRHRICSPGPPY